MGVLEDHLPLPSESYLQVNTNILEELAYAIFRLKLILKVEAAGFYKMISMYNITHCNDPENHSLNISYLENLKPIFNF
jgi:hypothetical protein